MFPIIKNVVNLILKNKRRGFYWLIFLMLILSALELAGLGVLIPIIGMLSENPESSALYSYMEIAIGYLGLSGEKYVIGSVLALLVSFFLIKSIYSLVVTYWQQYFVNEIFKEMAVKILDNSLALKYEEFQARDRSLYLKYIVNNSSYLSLCAFYVLQLMTEIFVLSAIMLFVGFYVGLHNFIYILMPVVLVAFLFKIITRNISALGNKRDKIMHNITRSATEALSGYREIRIQSVRKKVVDDFLNKAQPYARVYAKHSMLTNTPRIALETIAALAIIFYLSYIFFINVEFSTVMEELVVFAFTGLRIIPSLSKLLTSMANIKYFGTELDLVSNMFSSSNESKYKYEKSVDKFDTVLEVRNVGYKYKSTNNFALKNINFKIKKNKKYGFVGRSGSGKSTMFDLILGFLSPLEGEFILDGKIYRTFEDVDMTSLIGVVSQSVYTLNGSFRDNILFYDQQVDEEKFNDAIKGAQLLDLIDGNVERQLGEGGCNLSGGQRQRLAIARAIYSSKSILLLDEATSALDNQTERKFIEYLNSKNNHTVLIIAHRLSTIEGCDKIFVFKDGEVVDEGSYVELLANSEEFNLLVRGGGDEK